MATTECACQNESVSCVQKRLKKIISFKSYSAKHHYKTSNLFIDTVQSLYNTPHYNVDLDCLILSIKKIDGTAAFIIKL